MDFNQLGTVIFAIGTTMWIPIWSLFEGVAKCIRAFKGTDVTMEEFRSNKNDSDDEDLEENETKEENNVTKQKTKRTRTASRTTEKDGSEQK